jgi:hypothetical protein
MVDDLGLAGFVVQQALHGYGDGHRLLAGSVSLVPADARTMLVLSDASGGSTEFPNDGYLTGYPLGSSGKFVLARTWAAPEMSRPGCVWTHSLLIDFADLATLRSAAVLTSLFRRPDGSSRRRYEAALKVRPSLAMDFSSGRDASPVMALLGALYGSPRHKVVAHYSGEDDESLILALWMQQWPRLRRSFRFCTFSAADRSTSTEAFDLQLVDRNLLAHRFRLTDAAVASIREFSPALKPLLDDLFAPDHEGLRSFLRDVGGDVGSGRAAMLPLIRLFVAMQPGTVGQADFAAAFEVLNELGPSQARGARAFVFEQALDQVENQNDQVFKFILESVTASEKELSEPLAERLGRALWSRNPAALAEALAAGGVLADTVDRSIGSLDRKELLEGLAIFPSAATAIVKRRPDLMTESSLWQLPELEVDALLQAAAADPETAVSVIRAMIIAGRGDAAGAVARQLGGEKVIKAIESTRETAPDKFVPWINSLRERPEELAAAFAGGLVVHRGLLVTFANMIDPDAVPNDYGDDPWVLAIERSSGSLDSEAENFLAAFLLSRGLGYRTKQPERLLSLSVQQVHAALATGDMPWAGWRLIHLRLPWVWPWAEWDRCWRVRQAIVDRFVDFDLDPAQFGILTDDEALWRGLVDLAARTGRGRRYLERTRRVLRDSQTTIQKLRAEYIKKVFR